MGRRTWFIFVVSLFCCRVLLVGAVFDGNGVGISEIFIEAEQGSVAYPLLVGKDAGRLLQIIQGMRILSGRNLADYVTVS